MRSLSCSQGHTRGHSDRGLSHTHGLSPSPLSVSRPLMGVMLTPRVSLTHSVTFTLRVSHTLSHPQTNSLSLTQTHTHAASFLTHSALTLLQFPSRSRYRSHARLSPQKGARSRAGSLTCPRPAWPARGSRDCIPHAAPARPGPGSPGPAPLARPPPPRPRSSSPARPARPPAARYLAVARRLRDARSCCRRPRRDRSGPAPATSPAAGSR